MSPEELTAQVVARRERRAPETTEDRLGREALDGEESWSQPLRTFLRRCEERCGWAAHAPSFTTMAQTLARLAVERAFETAGVQASSMLMFNRSVDAVFDGYELACVLTGAGGDGSGRALKSAASVSTFAKKAARASGALDDGPLAEVVAALMPGWLKAVPVEHHEVGRAALRNAFGAGALLHHFETEARHPLLDGLRAATVKPRAAPEPEARRAPPNPAMIDAILAVPDDDEPRLVYADWLTEQGDPRGEFIQIQCTLGRTLMAAGARYATRATTALSTLSADELKERETRLIKRHEKLWKSEGPSLRQWFWRRGFIFAGVADARAFAEAVPALSRTPLERVQLTGLKAADVERIRAAPAHPTLWAIDFSSNRLSTKSAAVLRAPLFSTVRRLDLTSNDLSRADTARAVAAALETMPRLQHLNLAYTELDDGGLAALAESPGFARLTHLGLAQSRITPGGLALLARAVSLESLELSQHWQAVANDELWDALIAHAPPSLRALWAVVDRLPPRLQLALSKRFTIDPTLRSSVLYG